MQAATVLRVTTTKITAIGQCNPWKGSLSDRTTIFLHNASVNSLDELLNPKRGKKSPHPFYIKNATQRAEVVEFLRGLDVNSKK